LEFRRVLFRSESAHKRGMPAEAENWKRKAWLKCRPSTEAREAIEPVGPYPRTGAERVPPEGLSRTFRLLRQLGRRGGRRLRDKRRSLWLIGILQISMRYFQPAVCFVCIADPDLAVRDLHRAGKPRTVPVHRLQHPSLRSAMRKIECSAPCIKIADVWLIVGI